MMIDDDGFLFRTLFFLPIVKTFFVVGVGIVIWKAVHWFRRRRVLGELVYRTRRSVGGVVWEGVLLLVAAGASVYFTWRIAATDWNASIMGNSYPRGGTEVLLSVLLMVWGFAAFFLYSLFDSLVQLQFRQRGLFDKGWGFIRWSRVRRAAWRDRRLLVLQTDGTSHRFCIPDAEVEVVDGVLRSFVRQVDEEPGAGWRRGFVEVWCNRRTVLTLGLILVVLLANFVYQLGEYRREAAAAEQLEDAGAIIDWQANYVDSVDFGKSTRPTRENLEPLARLRGLRLLYFKESAEDGALRHLPPIHSLKEVYVFRSAITDAALESLSEMKKLQVLTLWRTKVAGEGTEYLRENCELRILDISEAPITRKGLESIGRLTQLDYLKLSRTPIEDDWLPALRDMSNLRSLILDDTRLTDAAIPTLVQFKQLAHLSLAGTKITNQSAEILKGMTHLESLDLSETSISAEVVSEIREALPGVSVSWEEEEEDPREDVPGADGEVKRPDPIEQEDAR